MPRQLIKQNKRRCYYCQKVKPLNQFTVDRTAAGGKSYRCKPCQKKAAQQLYQKKGKYVYAEMVKVYKLFKAGKLKWIKQI